MSELPYRMDLPRAAAHVSLSERSLREAINAGDLPCTRQGRKILIKTADVEVWSDSLPTEWVPR